MVPLSKLHTSHAFVASVSAIRSSFPLLSVPRILGLFLADYRRRV
jgi:hypothetical protein